MAESKYIQKTISIASLKHPEKYCGKIKDSISLRSSWEFAVVNWLDLNEKILSWSSEECVVPYINPLDRRAHRYFMDFYCKYIDKNNKTIEALIEVKPFSQTQKPILTEGMSEKSKAYQIQTYIINQAKWEAAKRFCDKRGFKFIILTEKDILPS